MKLSTGSTEQLPIGALERLPKWLISIPLVAQWIILGSWYRSFTLPSAANPRITTGGLVGERKSEYFADMGPVAAAATARHVSFRIDGDDRGDAAATIARAGLAFPVVVKPEIGWCGFGVQRIDSQASLADYLAAFPRGESVLFQEYVPHDGEAGIFYVRHPQDARGRIVGLALRIFPQVTGDGASSVAQLIAASPRARRLFADGMHRIEISLDRIPAAAEVVRLSTIGSLRVGGLYRNGAHLATAELARTIDAIARDMPHFHFGRFDVRYESESALATGTGFRIMEVNGAGSEAIEAWDPDLPALTAWGTLFARKRELFAVGAAMRRRGHRPVGLRELARLHLMQQSLIERYPPSN